MKPGVAVRSVSPRSQKQVALTPVPGSLDKYSVVHRKFAAQPAMPVASGIVKPQSWSLLVLALPVHSAATIEEEGVTPPTGAGIPRPASMVGGGRQAKAFTRNICHGEGEGRQVVPFTRRQTPVRTANPPRVPKRDAAANGETETEASSEPRT